MHSIGPVSSWEKSCRCFYIIKIRKKPPVGGFFSCPGSPRSGSECGRLFDIFWIVKSAPSLGWCRVSGAAPARGSLRPCARLSVFDLWLLPCPLAAPQALWRACGAARWSLVVSVVVLAPNLLERVRELCAIYLPCDGLIVSCCLQLWVSVGRV